MINLDDFSTDPDDYLRFAARHEGGVAWPLLFPDQKDQRAAWKAADRLSKYAFQKAIAMRLRAKGQISAAMRVEEICEGIYNHLPEFARW